MGNGQAVPVGNHVHRFGRTIFVASSAGGMVGVNDAVIPDEPGHAELHGLFGGQLQRAQRAGGTDLPATLTFIAAITRSEI